MQNSLLHMVESFFAAVSNYNRFTEIHVENTSDKQWVKNTSHNGTKMVTQYVTRPQLWSTIIVLISITMATDMCQDKMIHKEHPLVYACPKQAGSDPPAESFVEYQ